ncbi:MAG: aldo/keto reductase [Bdellovibrionota bacterium]
MDFISGYAVPESTKPAQNSLGRIFESRRRELFPGGPYVTPVGFGSYRIGYGKVYNYPECENALQLSLEQGLNIIDTSTNYGFGQSELLIGKMLKKLFAEKKLARENVVVVSKVGYIQGPNIEIAKVREKNGQPFPEVSQFGEETWHCIHPDFIFDQVERSRSRLGLETLDVYLLHNPEYMLKRFELDKLDEQAAQSLFYERIKQSFLALEQLVQENKIRAYGVSSNNLGAPEEEYARVSIVTLTEIANSISPNHHFKIVQMPFNWLEVSPLFYEINNTGHSTISYAQENKIGVMLNRPFNSMFNNGLVRLTRPQFSTEEIKNFDEAMKKGYENWLNLSADLEKIAQKQLELLPGYQDAPLSQLVLSTLMWISGVSCVLCGMRQTNYVHDVQKALERPALPHAKVYLKNIYENLEFHY